MEQQKECLRNTCVLVKSKAHAKRIIKFYEAFGFQNKITKTPEIGWYICAVDFTSQDGALLVDVICYKRTKGMKEIALQTKPRRKFPREMMVSNDKKEWEKRFVLGKIKVQNNPYVTDDNDESWNNLLGWQYAKEID